MLTLSEVVVATLFYVLLLFMIASYGERASKKAKNFINGPLVYSFSLAVYCTSWTFYGSVGMAANQGMLFLAIYLGPTLTIIVWWNVLRKLVRIKNKFNITSIVDFISARYDKSEGLGIIATSFIIVGLIPYISLQLKAITKTIHIVSATPEVSSALGDEIGLYVVVIMILCSIFFGIRKLNISERHPGMVLVLAFECFIKLTAFVLVGIFVSYFMNNGINDILDKIPNVTDAQFNFMGTQGDGDVLTWVTHLILASAAILFLPRQFHIAVIENNNEAHIKTAKWLFPLYLLIINLFVLPIAIGGKIAGLDSSNSDYFVLLLTQLKEQKLFSLFVFIGGFSAAAGMIMIETVAISTMITNNIFLPIFTRVKTLSWMTKHLLKLRWLAATFLISGAYFYINIIEEKKSLFSIGLISFAAALQFAPMILSSLYWRNGSKIGAYAGLSLGAMTWFYTLVIPSLVRQGFISDELTAHGLFHLSFLRPESLFGVSGINYLTHATFWTMFFNIGGHVFFSLLYPPSESEQKMADEFINALPKENMDEIALDISHDTISLEEKKEKFFKCLTQYCSPLEADGLFQLSLSKTQIAGKENISILKLAELYNEIEKGLAGYIGSAAAYNTLKRAKIISPSENEELIRIYSGFLTNMKINPSELKKQIILYQEKEKLMKKETQSLEEIIQKRSIELEVQKNLTFQASKLSALGEMAAGIAHEINNPLSIIKLNTHFLQNLIEKGITDKEVFYKHCNNIDSTVTRISKIITGLRAISRDDSKEDFTDAKPSDIIEDVLSLCREKFKAHGIELKVTMADEIYHHKINCRRVQISQVFLNLLTNSYDAIENLEDRWIHIDARIDNEQFIFRIEDSGRGISKDIQDKIFQPFFTTKDEGKGTGLGLSLSNAIIRNHKGTITLDNSSAHTCFIVSLPIKKRPS